MWLWAVHAKHIEGVQSNMLDELSTQRLHDERDQMTVMVHKTIQHEFKIMANYLGT